MTENFDEQYLDVLQNIEVGIIQVYRKQPDLTDYNVEKAINALMCVYQAQVTGHAAPRLRLREIEQDVFNAVKVMCDWRLGKAALEPVIVACLKRIRKSVVFWSKQGGRQGYLEYIAQFL